MTFLPQKPGTTNILAHLRFRRDANNWEEGGRKLSFETVRDERIEAYLEFETELELIDFKLRYL
jgi:hypothetical protein